MINNMHTMADRELDERWDGEGVFCYNNTLLIVLLMNTNNESIGRIGDHDEE
jgi:hypothetical protein